MQFNSVSISFLLLLFFAIGNVAAQSKDDEEPVDVVSPHNSAVEGSANAPTDDEDTVEGSGLPPSQVYSKLTTVKHSSRPLLPTTRPPIAASNPIEKEPNRAPPSLTVKEESVTSISPAIPKITTGRPETGPLALSNTFLIGLIIAIILLIVVVIVIIVVCRRKHKSDYTPGRQE
ncbi:hypothetical protein PFISCL1PPCAC_28280 [Pristionchus fissidentatus]|uniref:Uncharacterized protein n=1 Tax=Pristionchus fissidentatus TaxID=1538716 RepID=A0AAV5X1M6_9BILA|nr:hypothetical protein PFISCL1PPCAC_28280 [Pristionchus fissidentatus]